MPRDGTARLYGHPLACDNVQLHESAEALAKSGAASPHSSPDPRTHSPGCPHGQSRVGSEASQPSVRPPAQSIARHRDKEDNSQRLSAIHAVACLQVQTERTLLVVRDSVRDKRLTNRTRKRCDFLRAPLQSCSALGSGMIPRSLLPPVWETAFPSPPNIHSRYTQHRLGKNDSTGSNSHF